MTLLYEIKLRNGQVYEVRCHIHEIDILLGMIGESNYEYCEEL